MPGIHQSERRARMPTWRKPIPPKQLNPKIGNSTHQLCRSRHQTLTLGERTGGAAAQVGGPGGGGYPGGLVGG